MAFNHYRNKTVVIKYGGSAMETAGLMLSILEDIAKLRNSGVNVVIVHGGGPELSAMQTRLGIETKFIDGLRVTDPETVDAALMVLCGKLNKDIVRMLENEGCRAVGLAGIDGSILKCKRYANHDIGFVGEIIQIDESLISALIAGGFVPVISSVGIGEDGLAYNINADTAAGRIAAAMNADCFLALSDVPGVYRDMQDPASLIDCMDVDTAEELFMTGAFKNGMIPKVRGLIEAIRSGVRQAAIIDGHVPHALLLSLAERVAPGYEPANGSKTGFTGTTIVGGK